MSGEPKPEKTGVMILHEPELGIVTDLATRYGVTVDALAAELIRRGIVAELAGHDYHAARLRLLAERGLVIARGDA